MKDSKENTNKVYYVTYEQTEPQRIDNFLRTQLKGVPKSYIYKILRKGEVRVNKKRAKPEYKLQEGDSIRIPPVRVSAPVAKVGFHQDTIDHMLSRIIYEDDAILAVDKPSGMPVHGGTGVRGGVVEVLRLARPDLRHLELAHRLDKGTSGVLLLAKKRSMLKVLHDLFRANKMRKTYVALTAGHWQPSELNVNVPLLRIQRQTGERMVQVSAQGKVAISEFKVLKTFRKASLMEVNLKTGRTHQIRVHGQYMGHPIAGDDKYGDKAFDKAMRQYGIKRLFLHAKRLEFTLPDGGKKFCFESALDKTLDAGIKQLEK